MTDTSNDSEVMLILSPQEYDYLFKLMLDYGQYAPGDHVRIPLVKKLAHPMRITDLKPRRAARKAKDQAGATAPDLVPQSS